MYQWRLGGSWLSVSVHGGERSKENGGHVAGESPPSVQASLDLLGARCLGSETFSAKFPTGDDMPAALDKSNVYSSK